MADELVEQVRTAYAIWNRDDFDSARSMMHPEVEWYSSGIFPGLSGVYRGPEEVHRWWEGLKEPFDWFHADPERLERRGDTVLAAVRFEAVGRGSGARVQWQFAHLWDFRDGLVVSFRGFESVSEAEAALAGEE